MSQAKEKKRKRHREGEERPRKKKALADAPDTVIFTHVPDVGEWVPAIAYTPGLDFQNNKPLKAYSKTRTHLEKKAAHTQFSEELLLHSEDHPKLDYIAREEQSGEAESLLRHYIAVYDPTTGEAQVIPARKVMVRSPLKSARVGELEEKLEQVSGLEARTLLGEAFGTKKAQKAIQSLTENAITSPIKGRKDADGKVALDAAAAVMVDAMEQAPSTATIAQLQADAEARKPRPKANLEAETPAEVYSIESIVGEDNLRLLNVISWRDAVKDNTGVDTISRYVSRRLKRVVQTGDANRIKTLKYLLTLLEWKKCLKRGNRGGFKVPFRAEMQKSMKHIEWSIVDKIRKRFAPTEILENWDLHNLLTHICAMALIVDNFEVDVADLREDLNLEMQEITKYFRELGCRVSPLREEERKRRDLTKAAAVNHKVATLRLPLDFPKVPVRAAAKKGR